MTFARASYASARARQRLALEKLAQVKLVVNRGATRVGTKKVP